MQQALPVVIENERVRTGNLRRSTSLSKSGTGGHITATAEYAGFQNFGTKYMSGTHFMEAGLSAIGQHIPTELQKILKIV